MPFVPKFSACFEGPILDNVLVVIERDFKDALDYFYAADDLPDFAERSIGEERGQEFPLLVITPTRNPVEAVDDESHLIQAAGFDLYIGVIDDNAEAVTRKCMKYVRCLDAVLRTATKADYFAGFDTATFGMVIEVTHEYGVPGKNKVGQMFRPALLNLTVNIRER